MTAWPNALLVTGFITTMLIIFLPTTRQFRVKWVEPLTMFLLVFAILGEASIISRLTVMQEATNRAAMAEQQRLATDALRDRLAKLEADVKTLQNLDGQVPAPEAK